MKNNKLDKIKSSGFKSPTGYFESFDKHLFEKLEEKDVLAHIESGFNTPSDYFETLEHKITEKISSQNDIKVISLFNKKAIVYLSSIAAAIFILLNISIFEKNPSFDTLDMLTVENYIIDENISSYEIADVLQDETLDEDTFTEQPLDEEQLILFLLENTDIEDLMIE